MNSSSYAKHTEDSTHIDIHINQEQFKNLDAIKKAIKWNEQHTYESMQIFKTKGSKTTHKVYKTYSIDIDLKTLTIKLYINIIVDSPFLDYNHTTPISKLLIKCKE